MCDLGYLGANFSIARPLCSRLRPNVRNGRQTDRRQTKASFNARCIIIIGCECTVFHENIYSMINDVGAWWFECVMVQVLEDRLRTVSVDHEATQQLRQEEVSVVMRLFLNTPSSSFHLHPHKQLLSHPHSHSPHYHHILAITNTVIVSDYGYYSYPASKLDVYKMTFFGVY